MARGLFTAAGTGRALLNHSPRQPAKQTQSFDFVNLATVRPFALLPYRLAAIDFAA
jgi:hypothetical protein